MAPTMAAPLWSVNVPLIVEGCCACVVTGRKNKIPTALAETKTKKRSSLIFPPLPLARELKVVPVTMCRASLGCDPSPNQRARSFALRILTKIEIPLGFLAQRLCLARPSHRSPELQLTAIQSVRQWLAPKILRFTVARRRRIFTVFPCAESRLIVDGPASSASRRLRKRLVSFRDTGKSLCRT